MSRTKPRPKANPPRTTEPALPALAWLLFRNLAVPTLLFLVPLMAAQLLRPLSFLVSTRGAIAEVALQSLVVLGLEAALAGIIALILTAARRLGVLAPHRYLPLAGALGVAAATLCLVEFLSPLDGIVGAMAAGAIQIGAVVLEVAVFSLMDWRVVFRVFNRLNRSAQYVLVLAPLLLIPALMGGFGWRGYDPLPAPLADRSSSARPNIILISFDALTAQDMSLDGYGRPTTPQFERLARRSYNFTNFSTTSDFTTPAVASLLTGQYPLSDRVFALYGHIPARARAHNLAWILRQHGYTTAAIVTNPGAHPMALRLEDSFSSLPRPPITPWFFPGTFLLQVRNSLLFNSADGLTMFGLKLIGGALPSFNHHGWVSAPAVFAAARKFIRGTPAPYFLWLHIYPPHAPYVPEAPFRGRFLAGDDFTTQEQYLWHMPGPPYSPAQQPVVDRLRMRYDENIAQSDAALGQFLDWLDRTARRAHLILIVTADHGESFGGGWLGHGSPYLRYPETHIPLLLSLPDEDRGFSAPQDGDLSDIAPTVLSLLGIARPPWMDGHPLLSAAGAPQDGGPSFSMYLVNSRPENTPQSGVIAANAAGRHLVWYFPQNAIALYDIEADPEQTRNIAYFHPQTVANLMDAIRRRFGPQLGLAAPSPAP